MKNSRMKQPDAASSRGGSTSIGIVYINVSILLLAVANLVVRFGSHRYPSAIPGLERQTEET